MKLRRISTIEKHAEKVFFALMALALFTVLTMQFGGGPNTIKVHTDEGVPIDEAFQRVASAAQSKLRQLEQPEPDPQAPQEAPKLSGRFAAALEQEPTEIALIDIPLGPPAGDVGADEDLPPDEKLLVELAVVPAPSQVSARAFAGTIDPLVIAAIPDVLDRSSNIRPEQPYDMRAVSVEASFNAAPLIAALRADPDGAGPKKPVPLRWWQKRLAIVDVQLFRRELYPDGSYSSAALIAPPPGRMNTRAVIDEISDPKALVDLINLTREAERQLVQPAFYTMIAGEPWIPPAAASDASKAFKNNLRTWKRYLQLEAEIQTLERRLDSQQDKRSDAGLSSLGPEWVAQVGRPGGGGPRDRDRESDTRPKETKQDPLDRIRDQIQTRQQELSQLRTTLQAAGIDVENAIVASPAQDALEAPIGRLRDGQSVQVWAHDITVQAGKTYQYQIRVTIPNPLYGFSDYIAEEALPLAQEPVMVSEPSDWSEPVIVDPNSYLFVTNAGLGAGIGAERSLPTATVELFEFYYGYWRNQGLRLRPGDAVIGELALNDMRLPFFDIQQNEDSPAVAQVMDTSPDNVPVGAAGWFLLDIITKPAIGSGRGAEQYAAIFRNDVGDVIVREQQSDIRLESLQRLRDSAALGQMASVLDPVGDQLSPASRPNAGTTGLGGPGRQERDDRESRDGRPPSSMNRGRVGGG